MNTEVLDTTIARQLDDLCGLFDDELERQENVAALCRAQGEAAQAHDLQAVEARTQALALLIEEAIQAEKLRLRLLKDVVAYFDLPVERQSLSHLIAAVPDPWHHRMADFQASVKAVLAETRVIIRRNAGYMRRSLRIVNDSLGVVTGATSNDTGYRPDGQEDRASNGQPMVINAHG